MVLALLNAFKSVVCAFHFQIIFPLAFGVYDCFPVRPTAGSQSTDCISAFAFVRLTLCHHLIKLAAKNKRRNTSNAKFTNLLRDLTLAPFWYLPHLLFTTTPPVKVHSCYAEDAVVCNHAAHILCDPNLNSVLSPLSNATAAHSPWSFFSSRTNALPTSYCCFLPLLSPSTLSQIPGSSMSSLAML